MCTTGPWSRRTLGRCRLRSLLRRRCGGEYFGHALQKDEVIYVLAYPVFDQGSAERIQAFRIGHEPERAKLVKPHVTLVFGVADAHQAAVSDLVDVVASRTKAFPVVFDRSKIAFDPFEEKYKLFWLCGDGRECLSALHIRLYDGAHRAEFNAQHPFEPHMTVASYDERSDLEKVDVSAAGTFPVRAKVSALALVRLDGGRLTTLKTAALLG